MTTATHPAFDSWVAQMPLGTLEEERTAIQERFSVLVEDYNRMREQLEALNIDLERRSKIIEVMREIQGSEDDAEPEEEDEDAAGGQSALTKREMAERILENAEGRHLFPREVRDAAVGMNWLPATPQASNQLSVAMNRASKQGHFHKDNDGRYFLPPASNGDALFREDNGDGEES